jgi:hypothetical protein
MLKMTEMRNTEEGGDTNVYINYHLLRSLSRKVSREYDPSEVIGLSSPSEVLKAVIRTCIKYILGRPPRVRHRLRWRDAGDLLSAPLKSTTIDGEYYLM